jgi:para-aminobenzoate synthetase
MSERTFWLEGGGLMHPTSHRSLSGALDPSDVSLTYDATSRLVFKHSLGATVSVGDDIFQVLRKEMSLDEGDPDVYWVGYLGYACRSDFLAKPALEVPDAIWMRIRQPRFAAALPIRRPNLPLPKRVSKPPTQYATAFERVQEHLHAGNSYEVNLTYRDSMESRVHPTSAYSRLRLANPAPYAGYLRHNDVHLLSSSPERYATVDDNRRLLASPIKGTTRRGSTPAEDEQLRLHLSQDPKFRSENLMITDLLRNDLSMVCQVGTVDVPALMQVESYANVHQLVTTIQGYLRDDIGTIDAVHALFPAGSMTGAPKRMTMRIIDEVEWTPRGVYAGAFGWIRADGQADLGVVIRSLVATRAGIRWRYTYGTGGGITVQSTLEEEWAETVWKAERLRSILS